jgi:phosphonate transport system ATP-binding protein
MNPAIEIEHVRHRYPSRTEDALVIERLSIPAGQRVALVGHSGSGKTTLLRMINGLVRPLQGTIRVFGTDLSDPSARSREFRRRIGFVFQEFNLVERQNVFRNVLNGRLGWCDGPASLFGRFSETDRALAMAAIEETGLTPLARHRVDTLSGGQRQRVAIARVMAQAPELLCADEPVSNLDPVLSADMLDLIADAGRRNGATLVMIVHHPAMAARHADRVIGLANGRIVHDGDARDPLDAVTLRAIYGRSLAPEPVPEHLRDHDLPHDHVA